MANDTVMLQIIDPDLPPAESPEWTGTFDDFIAANADWPLSDEELATLSEQGFLVIGGGAAAAYLIRYATDEARRASQTFLDSVTS